MILSASRRTDIPAFYSEWLLERLRAGFVLVRNPMFPSRVSKVPLSPKNVDCIVFWTKDPGPLLPRLQELDAMNYAYYFQFTVTPYGRDIERNLREKTAIIRTFQLLSERLGKHRVLWRYDPVILNTQVDVAYHIWQFQTLCGVLAPPPKQVTVSFVDQYRKVKSPLIRPIREEEMIELGKSFSAIAAEHGIKITACCEALDFTPYGMEKARCIDPAVIEAVIGRAIPAKPGRNQRVGCGCVQSVDIGAYNCCANGCVYCYANYSAESITANRLTHNPHGELLLGTRSSGDVVTEKTPLSL